MIRLKPGEKSRLKELQKECFSSVSREEVEQNFIAEPFGMIFASEGGVIVGQSEVLMRGVLFENKEVLLGGIGGVCVTSSARNKGIATQLVRMGIEVLRDRRCDVVCLAANPAGRPLYQRLGFKAMDRRISFEDVNGRIKYDDCEMFLPLCSNEIFELIMKSNKTFHMGRGYW